MRESTRGGTLGSARVTRKYWYALGGPANTRCWRKQRKGGPWQYYYRHD